jgi:hypothetical protein
MKIRPVGAELFLANTGTDKTKLTVAFRNFANTPKNTHLPMPLTFLYTISYTVDARSATYQYGHQSVHC